MNDVTTIEAQAMIDYTMSVIDSNVGKIREPSTKSAPILIPADAAFAYVLLADFMRSHPVMVAEIDGVKVGASLDLEDAFRKFLQIRLTGICPDCGEPMAMHGDNEHVQTH